MVRTQVQLTPEQARALKRLAAERGVSMAALIREAVDRVVEDGERKRRWERALAAVGKYSSGHKDIAREHDRYLAEDFLA